MKSIQTSAETRWTRSVTRILRATVPGTALLAGAVAAHAQEPQPASKLEVESEIGGLQEIVVTAQRTEENLQRTPVSVTQLSSGDLAMRGIVDPAALQGLVPGVQFQPIGDVLANIRGIGTFNLQPGVDAAVAYNLDDVYIAHSTGLPPLFFDLARIEALRGPQGTLYGRNTNAGAINLITNKPKLGQFEAMASAQLGNYDLFASEAMVNIPVGEKIALRTSFASQHHDGYMRDGHNDAKIYAGRVRLRVDPNEDISLVLTADYAKQSGVGWGGSTPCPANYVTAGCNTKAWDAYAGNETPVPNDFRHVENVGLYGQLGWDLGAATLTAITSWRWVDSAYLQTTGDSTVPFGDFGYKPSNTDYLLTQELRLNSAASSPVKWVVGAYYSRETLRSRIDRTFLNDTFLGVSEVLTSYRSVSKALFAQATVPVSDSFRVTGGLRYTNEKKSAVGQATSFFASPPVVVATGGAESHSRLTWKAGLEYDVAPTSLLYANVSTGFKSGGVNQTPAGFGVSSTYDPERITAYQAGTKNRFFSNRVQINAEFFYYRYLGFQEILSTFAPGYFAFYTANSQRARVYGGEVETQISVSKNGRLDASLALLNSKFTLFDLTALGGANYSGNRMRNAPAYTVNLGYQHSFPLPGEGEILARIDTQFVGKFMDITNSIAGTQRSHTQTSASLRYQPGNGIWSVTGWVRNLEDKTVMYSYFAGRGYPQAPRTFGVTLRVNTN